MTPKQLWLISNKISDEFRPQIRKLAQNINKRATENGIKVFELQQKNVFGYHHSYEYLLFVSNILAQLDLSYEISIDLSTFNKRKK